MKTHCVITVLGLHIRPQFQVINMCSMYHPFGRYSSSTTEARIMKAHGYDHFVKGINEMAAFV
uniref:Myosin motor domain-containing protein n=1 Tax=Ascaris lumbricoides TaxID=6252 RepID=A0A0M3HZQ7_ASCLU